MPCATRTSSAPPAPISWAGDAHDGPMPLDYFVWAISGRGPDYCCRYRVRCGAGGKAQTHPGTPRGGWPAGDRDSPCGVKDVVITHMHYDHSGNHHLFPDARMHLQDAEMRYCTGRWMTHAQLRAPFEAEDVAHMVRRVFEERVLFHDGDAELAPGITLHRVGGHTPGLAGRSRVHRKRAGRTGLGRRPFLRQPRAGPAVSDSRQCLRLPGSPPQDPPPRGE